MPAAGGPLRMRSDRVVNGSGRRALRKLLSWRL
jgi:hypothetical protein